MKSIPHLILICVILLSTNSAVKAAPAAKKDIPQGYAEAPQSGKAVAIPAMVPIVMPAEIDATLELKDDKVDPQVIQLEKQHREQFKRYLLNVELAFIRRACDLDESQRETIAKAGEKCLSKVLRQCALAQNAMQQGMIAGQQREVPNARKLLQKQFSEVLNKSLRPEQLKRYHLESKARDASRKQAVIHYMVAIADQKIMLSANQREKLIEALNKNYSDTWEQRINIWTQNVLFMPSIPDARILPVLNEKQKTLWQSMDKTNNIFWGMDLHVPPGISIIEDKQ